MYIPFWTLWRQKRHFTDTPPQNVAVLFVATGRYIVFWEDFYRKCEKWFLPRHNKTYFLFTDNNDFPFKNAPNVRRVFQKKLGWPYDTLLRFRMFRQIDAELSGFDYIYFINGTMIPVSPVNEEIFPTPEQGLMVTLHPGYFGRKRRKYPYENNPASRAHIASHQGKYYFMGGFNGGRGKEFRELIAALDAATDADSQNKIIAVWHDESHLNRYMLDKHPLILPPSYGFPEGMPFNKFRLWRFKRFVKMLIKDKSKPEYGGHDWLRGVTDNTTVNNKL